MEGMADLEDATLASPSPPHSLSPSRCSLAPQSSTRRGGEVQWYQPHSGVAADCSAGSSAFTAAEGCNALRHSPIAGLGPALG